MQLFIIVGCLVAVTVGEGFRNVYAPAGGAFAPGANPYNAYNNPYNNPGYVGGYDANARFATILRYNNQNNGDGTYHFDYATSNGIQQQENGRLKNPDTSEVQGSYSYTSPEGKQISVNYVADEYGFRPSGAHLPTPPPIPDAILRSIEYNAAHPNDDGQYRGGDRYDAGGFYNRNVYNRGYRY